MRILVVNKFFWMKGGSERVMFDLLEGYERAGHDVAHFAMRSPRNVPSPQENRFVSEIDYDGARGFHALRAAARAVYSREAKRAIAGVVRDVRPDVAHLHNFHHQLSPSIVDALADAGVPAVHTLHDYKVICPNYLLYTEGAVCERCRGGRFHEAVLHRCMRGAIAPSVAAFVEMTFHRWRGTLERGIARFVSPSRFLAGKLREFGVAPERIRIVPNGLDPSRFEVAPAPGTGFLYAGRLSHEKGLGTLVEAVGRAGGVRLTITGTGPEEAAVAEHAERVAPGRVELTGFLRREELLERMRGARALVLPSEWYENAPIAALEALASGVPVVGADIGGIPETVRSRETGLLFPPGDAGALASRLEELHADAGLAFRMGRAGRSLVERKFTLGVQVRDMLAVLAEVAPSASR